MKTLVTALQCNDKVLSLLVDKKKREAQRLVKPLDTGTWDAVRPLLPASFADPKLLRRLAYHWVQLGQVTAMHHMILQQQLAASSHSPSPMLSAMQNECDEWLKNLQSDSEALRNDLNSHLNDIRQ